MLYDLEKKAFDSKFKPEQDSYRIEALGFDIENNNNIIVVQNNDLLLVDLRDDKVKHRLTEAH